MRRIPLTGLLVTTLVMALVVAAPTPAEAAGKPVLSKNSPSAGPLGAHRLTLVGTGLGAITAVRLGRTRVPVVGSRSSTSITVKVPAVRSPVRSAVRLFVRSKAYRSGTYSRLARPVVLRASVAAGPNVGGTTIKLDGRHLDHGAIVKIGTAQASIRRRSATSLTITTPPNVVGRTSIVVRTPGGTSRSIAYTYTTPPARDSSSLSPRDDTIAGSGVAWVDTDPDEPSAKIVSIEPGSPVPSVDQTYYLAPGTPAYPSGLAGRVTSIAVQGDGGTRVSVEPAPLDQVISGRVDYSGTVSDADAGIAADGALRRRSRMQSAPGESNLSFPGISPNAFACHDGSGDERTYTGTLGLRFENVNPSFSLDLGDAFRAGSLDATVSGTAVVYGKVSASTTLTCALRPEWTNAHRRVIFIGTSGLTLSFGPSATFSLSQTGTVSIEHRTRFMVGVAKFGDQPTQMFRIARDAGNTVGAEGSYSLGLKLGLSAQFGLADRIGVELAIGGYASGTLSSRAAADGLTSCLDLELGGFLQINAFLDVWVARWTVTGIDATVPFGKQRRCLPPTTQAQPTNAPTITTTSLPDARVDESYEQTLGTSDGREGRWTVPRGGLPDGLTLSSTGTVSGTPLSGVGRRVITVRFTDSSGRVDEQPVSLVVRPSRGLGGGDIQATLSWDSAADLDLHGIEPSGDHLYYGNSGPSSGGGSLDTDAHAGCDDDSAAPVENLSWPSASAARGTYSFWVNTYDECGAGDLTWHLQVRVRGRLVLDTRGSGGSDAYSIVYGSAGVQVRHSPVPADARVKRDKPDRSR